MFVSAAERLFRYIYVFSRTGAQSEDIRIIPADM